MKRATLEHQLAQLTTATLRWKMERLSLVLPEEAACWTRHGEGGVLTSRGIAHIEQQLRHARRQRLIWWCLLFLSVAALVAGAVTSLSADPAWML